MALESPAAKTAGPPRPLEPLDADVSTIQPGGGVCMRLELAWGYVRRWWLGTFFSGYVERMRLLRQGDVNACPFEPLDPRDVKFHRNQNGYWWKVGDDPFTWRNKLPFVRWGLCELLVLGGFAAAATVLPVVFFGWLFWPLAILPAALGLLVAWFFRNPRRTPPLEPELMVSPADGRIVAIERLEHEEYFDGPAVSIAIFLSLFNVHVNRAPETVRVVGIRYRRGKFFNAMRPEASRENEQLTLRLETIPADSPDGGPAVRRPLVVKQITGAVARRIVCEAGPGAVLQRGETFGMIKLGSRTELVLPDEPDLELKVQTGDRVKAGLTVLAQYKS